MEACLFRPPEDPIVNLKSRAMDLPLDFTNKPVDQRHNFKIWTEGSEVVLSCTLIEGGKPKPSVVPSEARFNARIECGGATKPC